MQVLQLFLDLVILPGSQYIESEDEVAVQLWQVRNWNDFDLGFFVVC